MRSKKVIALLISLTLLVSSVLPGTLAVSIDQDAASSSVTLTSGKQETPTPAPEEQQEQKDQNEQQDQNEQETICTCGSTDGTHAEDCPLYEAPKTLTTPAPGETTPPAPEKTCTCGSTNDTHTEDCPLYEAPDTLLATPAPVSDPAAKTLEIRIEDTTTAEKPYVLVDVTCPNGYSKRVAVQVNAENETSIYGLQSGTYTCTVVTGWSWRYGDQSASVTMDNESVGSVTLSIHQENSRWLDGNAYRKNTFSN